MTGAPMPALADAVIMREEADEADGQVSFRKHRAPASTSVGPEDVQPGSTVLLAGALLSAGKSASWPRSGDCWSGSPPPERRHCIDRR